MFVSKYRKKVWYGKLREIISTLCKYKDVEIIDGVSGKPCVPCQR